MKIRIINIIISAVIIAIVACNKKDTSQTPHQQQTDLHVAAMPTLDCLPIFVAEKLQLFQKQQLNVQVHTFQAQLDIDTALIGGTVQTAITDLVRAERMQKKGTYLSYITLTNTQWQLYTPQAARIKSPKQLGDKNLAMTRFSATDLLTNIVIKKAKPSNSVYKIQVNNVNIRLNMLINRQVEAAWLTEPQATEAKNAKCIPIADSKDEDLRLGVIAFRTDINKKGYDEKTMLKKIEAFKKAYNEAVDSIQKYGVKNYTTRLKEVFQIDEKTIKALPNIEYSHATPPLQSDIDKAKMY